MAGGIGKHELNRFRYHVYRIVLYLHCEYIKKDDFKSSFLVKNCFLGNSVKLLGAVSPIVSFCQYITDKSAFHFGIFIPVVGILLCKLFL